MIIKTLSRKQPRFEAAISYVDKQKNTTDKSSMFDQKFRIYHNIMGVSKTAAIQSFRDNHDIKKKRKNGIAMIHEVLSFHKESPVTQKAIEDISQEYIRFRASNALVYGAVHSDKEHIHLHLIISSNEVGSSKAIRLDNNQFKSVRKSIEEYQLAHYPELYKSIVYLNKEKEISKRGIQSKEQKYKELQKRLDEEALSKGERRKTTNKERVNVYVTQSLENSDSLNDFYELVSKKGLNIYERNGKKTGVIYKNRKYRFVTIIGKEKWKEFLIQDARMQQLKAIRDMGNDKTKEKEVDPNSREERLRKARERENDDLGRKI